MTLTAKHKKALLEAVRMMADFFWGPKLEQSTNMLQSTFWQPIVQILPWLDSSSIQTFDSIMAYPITFPSDQALYDGLEEEYVRLFINDRQGLRTPLYASCYVGVNTAERASLMGEPALAMQERFLSKGLFLAEDIGEPPDHLSVELEYLYFLLNKGWADLDGRLLAEASSFASGTMLPWIIQIEQALRIDKNPGRFYPLLVTLVAALLRFIGTMDPVV